MNGCLPERVHANDFPVRRDRLALRRRLLRLLLRQRDPVVQLAQPGVQLLDRRLPRHDEGVLLLDRLRLVRSGVRDLLQRVFQLGPHFGVVLVRLRLVREVRRGQGGQPGLVVLLEVGLLLVAVRRRQQRVVLGLSPRPSPASGNSPTAPRIPLKASSYEMFGRIFSLFQAIVTSWSVACLFLSSLAILNFLASSLAIRSATTVLSEGSPSCCSCRASRPDNCRTAR